MRKILSEYLDVNNDEKNNLWQNATFVFDTNVLLNLYRYSSKTRNELLDAFEVLKDRIWLPYNVGAEFLKDRCEVIYNTTGRYITLNNLKSKFIDECKNALRLDDKDIEITELNNFIEKWLQGNKDKNVSVINPSEDIILERILNLFDDKIGTPYTQEEITKIFVEGELRYKTNTPPGYKDKIKQKGDIDNNAYGDLIIWKQLLDFSKKNNKDVIFITHDQKEDWWVIINGKTIGPRYELKKEFTEITSKKFLMYTMDNFINYFNKYNGNTVDQISIDEVKNINYANDEIKKTHDYEKKIIELQNGINKREDEIYKIRLKYKDINNLPDNVQKNYNNLRSNINKLKSELKEIEFLRLLDESKNICIDDLSVKINLGRNYVNSYLKNNKI